MTSVCFYFQVHQPYRLRKYTFFDIGKSHFYFDDTANAGIMRKVAHKCYLPTNQLLLELIKKYQGRFRIAYSISGVAIEQMRRYSPETLESFKRLAETGSVEFLCETYFHSLSFLYSHEEFKRQVSAQKLLIQSLFNYTPTTFRNTELIYSNDVARVVADLGFQTVVCEGADHVLGWRSPNFVYTPMGTDRIRLLLKNYRLSDDIAFRFSNRGWSEYPLTTDKFAHWVHALQGNADTVNLFMDYETFGEHQWADTGIFDFLRHLPEHLFRHPDFEFLTPGEVSQRFAPVAALDIPHYISWADLERDLSAWNGNHLQRDALERVYHLEPRVYHTQNSDLIHTWQTLLTSDHFYYMCTKWFSDGDVHKYFNPYDNPYDAYINFQNILSDFELQLN